MNKKANNLFIRLKDLDKLLQYPEYYQAINNVCIGIERVDEYGGNLFNKKYSKRLIEELFEKVKMLPFEIVVFMIVGIPGETLQTLQENIDFVDRVRSVGGSAVYSYLTHQTNSELYRENPNPGWWKDIPLYGGNKGIEKLNIYNHSDEIRKAIKNLLK